MKKHKQKKSGAVSLKCKKKRSFWFTLKVANGIYEIISSLEPHIFGELNRDSDSIQKVLTDITQILTTSQRNLESETTVC